MALIGAISAIAQYNMSEENFSTKEQYNIYENLQIIFYKIRTIIHKK